MSKKMYKLMVSETYSKEVYLMAESEDDLHQIVKGREFNLGNTHYYVPNSIRIDNISNPITSKEHQIFLPEEFYQVDTLKDQEDIACLPIEMLKEMGDMYCHMHTGWFYHHLPNGEFEVTIDRSTYTVNTVEEIMEVMTKYFMY